MYGANEDLDVDGDLLQLMPAVDATTTEVGGPARCPKGVEVALRFGEQQRDPAALPHVAHVHVEGDLNVRVVVGATPAWLRTRQGSRARQRPPQGTGSWRWRER